MTVIRVHLCSSVVNTEIEIIPACFLSAHALSMGLESGVRVAALGVGGCCRQGSWLLKYKIYEILHRKVSKVKFTMSLRTLRSLR